MTTHRLPKTYPKALPTFTLEDPKGLLPPKVTQLQGILKQSAQDLQGSEAIFELVSAAAAFISENHGVTRPTENISLIEELGKRAEATRQAELAKSSQAEAEEQLRRVREREELAQQIETDRKRQLEALRQSENRWTPSNDGAAKSAPSTYPAVWHLALSKGPIACTIQTGSVIRELTLATLHAVQLLSTDGEVLQSATSISIDFGRAKLYYGSTAGQRKLAAVQDDLTRLEGLVS